MNRDIKEVVIYISLILFNIVLAILIPLSAVVIPDEILNNVDGSVVALIFLVYLFIAIFSYIIITIIAIKKAKGKYLRTFFDNIIYSTALFFLIVVSNCIIDYLYYERIDNEFIIKLMCNVLLFSVVAFGIFTRSIKKVIFFTTLTLFFIVIMPVISSRYWYGDMPMYALKLISIDYFLIYATILFSKFFKFIKSKVIKINK